MKKLISKMLILGSIVTLLVIGMNEVYKKGYYLNTLGVGQFENVPTQIQIANLGNSHGAAFVYDDYKGIVSFNFSLGGQHLIYDYLLLKNYESHFNTGAIILIEVSYFDLYRTVSEIDDREMLKRYYFILNSENNPRYSVKDDFLYHYFPILAIHPDSIVKVCKNIYDYYLGKIKNSNVFSVETSGKEISLGEQIDVIASARVDEHYRYCQQNNGEMDSEQIEALNNIIELCQENKWIPIIVTTPYTVQYSSYWPDEVLDEMRTYLYGIAEKYGIEYLDYSEDSDFSEDLSLFVDSDHLNSLGNQRFSAKLKDYIYSRGYLKSSNVEDEV